MRRTVRVLIAAGVTLGAALGTAAPAGASIVTSEASLVNGQLTIVGSGAVPNSTVSVDDGPPVGQADAAKLPAGTLSWRVRALDSQGPGDWSVTFQLTVAPS